VGRRKPDNAVARATLAGSGQRRFKAAMRFRTGIEGRISGLRRSIRLSLTEL